MQNFWRYFGRDSAEGEAAQTLRKTYNEIKPEYLDQLGSLLGPQGIKEYKLTMAPPGEDMDEDRIDCFCGQYKVHIEPVLNSAGYEKLR